MGTAIPTFLKNLFELAAASPNVVVIITLATTANAFGTETDELSSLLDETEADYRDVLEETVAVHFRLRPAVYERIFGCALPLSYGSEATSVEVLVVVWPVSKRCSADAHQSRAQVFHPAENSITSRCSGSSNCSVARRRSSSSARRA